MHKINSKRTDIVLCIWLLKTNLKILCNDSWVKKEIKKIPVYLKLNDNENAVSQNLYDSVKVVVRFKYMLVKK